jgi:ribonuclease D
MRQPLSHGRSKRRFRAWPERISTVSGPRALDNARETSFTGVMVLITKTDDLAAFCARASSAPFVTVDTEFLRETTFWPKLCVIQLADANEAIAVDALADGLDLSPFFALMQNPSVTKVFHAARQDIEIIWKMSGHVPAPLFDTQVAAMVCGYGDQVSYEQLAGSLASAKIDKSSRFTDWSRRPLSEAQIVYALADVTHLRIVYAKLADRLEKSGRRSWLDSELDFLSDPATYEQKPENAWLRLKNRARRPRDLAIIMELSEWREREAQGKDVPRSRILKDDTLVEVALAAPTSIEALGRLRTIPQGYERSRAGQDMVAAVQRGLERDPATLPQIERHRGGGGANSALVPLLKVLLQIVCDETKVASKMIATVEDLDAIVAGEDSPVLHGWRRELFGERALKLMAGELSLAAEKGRIVAEERLPKG